jgi:hypothetical protein
MGIVKKIVDAVEGPPHAEVDADPEVRAEAAAIPADEASRLADRDGTPAGSADREGGMPGSSGGTDPIGSV